MNRKEKLMTGAALGLILTGMTAVPTFAGTREMYRLYNPNSGEHFYTASTEERNGLIALGWNYESVGWVAPDQDSSSTPVYRLYNTNNGDHHYTRSAEERSMLISIGWNDEGIGWYSADTTSEYPLYRLFNPNAKSYTHHYTVSVDERNILTGLGWNDEGIGWYAAAKGRALTDEEKNLVTELRQSAKSKAHFTGVPRIDYVAEQMVQAAGVTSDLSEDEKVRRIYAWMVKNWTHIESNSTNAQIYYNVDDSSAVVTAYRKETDALVNSGKAAYDNSTDIMWNLMKRRVGQCDTISKAFQIMCEHVGVESGLCNGLYKNRNGTNVGHTWPYAVVDGVTYYYDIDVEIKNRNRTDLGGVYWYKKTRAQAEETHIFQ